MTTNQINALQEANTKRAQVAARARILKVLVAGTITNGHAVLLLVTHAGMYKHQAVNVVTEVTTE